MDNFPASNFLEGGFSGVSFPKGNFLGAIFSFPRIVPKL